MATTTLDKLARGEKPQNQIARFSNFLDKLKPQIALALPRHLTADRMARLALTQFSTNPALQECSAPSIAGALLTAAQLGLEIGVNGQAYLIPYKGQATLVPGWRGLVDLVNRSGRATVWTGAVFEGDDFDYALGDSPFVKHRPGEEDDPTKLLYVYAIGRVKDSDRSVIEVWRVSKIWKHRDRFNKVGKRHYSYEHPEMYARKIPLLQVLKYMPSSIELSTAMVLSEAADSGQGMVLDGDFTAIVPPQHGVDPETGEAPPPPPPSAPSTPVPPPPAAQTYDQFADAMTKASDPEIAALVLDEARGLPQIQYDDLVELYDNRFGGKP